jgi:hypothetical protein
MCTRGSGNLVDGKLPVEDPETNGSTELSTDEAGAYLYARNLADYPYPGLAVAFICNAGGVTWPEVIGFYGDNLDLLASFDLGSIDHNEHSVVSSMAFRDRVLHVEWSTYDGAGFGTCDPNNPDTESADFHLGDTGVAVEDLMTSCDSGQ